jgi:L,D-transpeptidase ErfK/SrfK
MISRNRLTASATIFASALALGSGACVGAPEGIVGEPGVHRTTGDDTLLDIAHDHDVGYVAIIAANPVIDPWAPGAGRDIVLPTQHILPDAPHEGIVVNIAEMRLYYFSKKDAEPQTYPIGIGDEGTTTPNGTTRIVRKAANPTWYRTKSEIANKPGEPRVVPPGPDNPLGAYALYLGWPAVLIHGTDDWRRVGRRDSRGCMGMYAADIEAMFHEVPIGTKVTVVNQPVKLGWVGDRLYLEVHPTAHQANQLEMDNIDDYQDPAGITKMILAAAKDSASRLDWAAIRQAAKDRSGIPVAITR